eukprot:TRINITY_DN2870_c0_g1_i8.p1 TRINITY_DN2870_c0_g1~~TRINITY_DN2870_c0_g1_i8.p1  ORF type:complete len:365 (-),score=85.91 TRINITY_DN2870_c0_g1_i8:266-1228(-)
MEDEGKAVINNSTIVSTNVLDSPHKIFIGGLPASLGEGTIKELLLLFGQLKAFNLVRDSTTGISKGYAFCEYVDSNVTDIACKSLNGMTFGDKNLMVQRASAGAKTATEIPEPVIVDPRAAAMLTLSVPANQLLATAVKNPNAEPTRILVLMNIINITDFPGDKIEDEYNELYQDIGSECSKFGPVVKLIIPRPAKKIIHDSFEHFSANKWVGDDPNESDDESDNEDAAMVPGLGKIFVEYDCAASAKKAQTSLSGRLYDGRMVITSFHPEDKWERGELEPDPLDGEYLPHMFPHVSQKIGELQQQANLEVLKSKEQNGE